MSVENPEQQIGSGLVTLPACCGADIDAQYNTGKEALSVPNLMPDLVTRVAFNPTTAFHVDVGGVWRVFRHTLAPYDEVQRASGGGVSVNVRVTRPGARGSSGRSLTGPASAGRWADWRPTSRSAATARSPDSRDVVGRRDRAGRDVPRSSLSGYYSGMQIDDTHFVDTDGATSVSATRARRTTSTGASAN